MRAKPHVSVQLMELQFHQLPSAAFGTEAELKCYYYYLLL